MSEREWVEKATILRAKVGSTVHGLALDGTDDVDEMGVCIEPPERVMGQRRFEQYEYRSAMERAGLYEPDADPRAPAPPSMAGDLDLTIYSLRKYVLLAAAGNPSILVLLYAPAEVRTEWGHTLQAKHALFACRQAGMRFLRYMQAQKERLLGIRGQMRVTRTDLIQKHGYDTKFAMHAVRLGYQGIEYVTYGSLMLPMDRPYADELMAIRRGEWSLSAVVARLGELEGTLVAKMETTHLPEWPDHEAIDRFLVGAYMETWRSRDLVAAVRAGNPH